MAHQAVTLFGSRLQAEEAVESTRKLERFLKWNMLALDMKIDLWKIRRAKLHI